MKHVKISGHVFWEIMVHLLFVIVIIICIVASFPENLNKAEEVDIIVDQVDYVYERKEYRLSIYSDSIEYKFSEYDCEYTIKELSKLIKKGDLLSIKYIENYNVLYGDYYEIVDARSQSNVYLSIDSYSDQQNTSLVISLLFAGILLSLIITGDVIYYRSLKKADQHIENVKIFHVIEKINDNRNYRIIKEMPPDLYRQFNSEYSNLLVKSLKSNMDKAGFSSVCNKGIVITFDNGEYELIYNDQIIDGKYKEDNIEEIQTDAMCDPELFQDLIDKYLNI